MLSKPHTQYVRCSMNENVADADNILLTVALSAFLIMHIPQNVDFE